jgi:autotransporter translocation and assembly factor TamB
MRKVLLVGLGVVASLVLVAAGFAAVLLVTAPGHEMVRRLALRELAGKVNGTIRVGGLSGALWRVVDLRDVELADSSGTVVVRAERVRAGFSLPELLRRRIVLRSVTVTGPVLNLEQDSSGSWNLERLFPPGARDTAPPRPALHLALRDLAVAAGQITLRPRDGETIVISELGASLASLRISHPDSSGLRAEVRNLSLRLHDPVNTRLLNMAGTVALDGDSARFDLSELRLAGTTVRIAGSAAWGGARPVLDATVEAASYSSADFLVLEERLPGNGTGRLSARVRWLASGAQEYEVSELTLRSGRSALRASGRVARSARGALSVRGADLVLAPFDLALLGPWVDSIPLRGTVSGRLRAAGASSDLGITADLAFADEAAQPIAISRVTGSGRLSFGTPAGFSIPGLDVTGSSLELATARHFVPGFELGGRVEVVGHVEVSREAVTWAGILRHHGASGISNFTGLGRVGLEDSLVLAAEVVADSVRFGSVRELAEGLPLRGAGAGRLKVDGPLAELGFEAELGGPWGRFEGRGAFADLRGAFTLIAEGVFDSLDASRHVESAPRSRLSGTWALALTLPRDGSQPSGNAEVGLSQSLVEGVRVRGAAGIAFVPGRLLLDSARLIVPGGELRAAGALGFPDMPPGQVTWQVRLDTLAAMEPLMRYALRLAGDSGDARMDGHGSISGRVVGTLADWDANGRLALERGEAAGFLVRGAQGAWRVASANGAVSFSTTLTADTTNLAGLGYSALRLAASGRPDSVTVNLRAGFVAGSQVRLAAAYQAEPGGTSVRLDTLELDLPAGPWVLAAPGSITARGGVLAFDTLRLESRRGTGHLALHGSLPRSAPGEFTLEGAGIALADLFALAGRDTAGIGGSLDLGAKITGAAAAPAMEAQLYLADGRFGATRVPAIQVLASYEDRHVTLKGGLWRDTVRVMALSGALPLDLALTGAERRRIAGPLSLSLRADSADLSILRAVTDQVRDPRGYTNLDIRIAGTWEDYHLTGRAELLDASLSVPAIGARYSRVDARFALLDTVVRLERFSARGGDGTLSVGGTVVFPRGQRPVLGLTATAERFHAFEIRNFAGMTGSGSFTLNGPAIGATLAGRLTVDQGFLRFADLVEKRIVNLDDPEFRAIVDSTLARAQDLEPGLATIFLDSMRIRGLTVVMGPDVWLRSSEANIQLAGEFQVRKEIEFGVPRYRMDGTMSAVRGNYRLSFGTGTTSYLAREFRVSRGTVRFFGTPSFDPELDIAAEHVVRRADGGGNLTVRAVIGGTLLTPRLRLESDERPPLSEIELVSYMLTGRPVSALTQRGGFDPLRDGAVMMLGELSQALVGGIGLPLDVLTIRPGQGQAGRGVDAALGDALTGATIEAGRQFGARTYVSLNAGLCEVATSQAFGVSVEYRLSRQFSTSASLEPIVDRCRAGGGVVDNTTSRHQFAFDLFWFLGGVR